MKAVGYLKTSKYRQDVREQRQAILEFAEMEGITVSGFIEMPATLAKEKRIANLLSQVRTGDTLIVSELNRIGRSVGQIVRTVEALIKGNIRFISINEGIWLDEERSADTQVMVRMFMLLADVDRELITEHTKEGISAARDKGKKIGRPKGSLGSSKLDGRRGEIKRLLSSGVSVASIAKIMGVSRGTLNHFVRSRRLV